VSSSVRNVSNIGLRRDPQQSVSLNEKSAPKDTRFISLEPKVERYFSKMILSSVLVFPLCQPW
jgi:hypothetical protein